MAMKLMMKLTIVMSLIMKWDLLEEVGMIEKRNFSMLKNKIPKQYKEMRTITSLNLLQYSHSGEKFNIQSSFFLSYQRSLYLVSLFTAPGNTTYSTAFMTIGLQCIAKMNPVCKVLSIKTQRNINLRDNHLFDLLTGSRKSLADPEETTA